MSLEHIQRAACEYMLALRPQPSPAEVQTVLNELAEKDDKGQLTHKCKDIDAAVATTDSLLAQYNQAAVASHTKK
jgi:hypothetical protein